MTSYRNSKCSGYSGGKEYIQHSGEIIKRIDSVGYSSADNDNDRHGVEFSYDLAGRLVEITTPEAKIHGRKSQQYTYDAEGNITGVVDGNGNSTRYSFGLMG